MLSHSCKWGVEIYTLYEGRERVLVNEIIYSNNKWEKFPPVRIKFNLLQTNNS